MTHGTDDLDDPLGALFGGAASSTPKPAVTPPASYQPKTHFEPCPKCAGSGQTRWGVCFRCKGQRGKTFKQAPEVRAAKRRSAAMQVEDQAKAWLAANPAEAAWLTETAKRNVERAGNFDFPGKLLTNLWQYGSLTEGQIGAVRKLMARAAERSATRAAEAKTNAASAPEINIAGLEAAFAKAASSLKKPRLHLDDFTISHAGAQSRNAGALYVTDRSKLDGEGKPEYLGKIMGGKFLATRNCGADRQAAVLAAAADPQAATIRYGRLTGRCGCCGRPLENPESVARGIGPICAEKYGW